MLARVVTVGIDANPHCVTHCKSASSNRRDLHPSATVEWLRTDCTILTAETLCALSPDPSQLVIYLYLGSKQLLSMMPALLQCIRAGARIVTFHEHLIFTSTPVGVSMSWIYDGMLRCYERDGDGDDGTVGCATGAGGTYDHDSSASIASGSDDEVKRG